MPFQTFVNRQQKDDAVALEIELKDDDGNPIIIGVTIDVLDQDGLTVKSGQAATHLGSGLWRYILPAVDFDSYGTWVAVWHWTVDTTARQHRVLFDGGFA